jgi:hypothetical protein
MAEHRFGGRHPHPIRVVDAIPAGQGRLDQGHSLEAHIGPARRVAQVDELVEQLAQAQMLGQGGRGDQPGVGHRMIVVEGHADGVETVR